MSEDVIPWRTDAELEADDRLAEEMDAAGRYALRVSKKVDELRVLEDARARLRAETAADLDFASLYLDREQLRSMPTPDPLIDGVLPRNVYAVLRGRDQSFKSFVAQDWGACLATNKPWQGHPVQPGRVLYIAGEGVDGIAKRLDAWEYSWAHKIDRAAFVTRKVALNMYAPGPAFVELLEHIKAGEYALVVIDTLRRVSGAADGNGSEMGRVIDNLDQVKHATADGSVLVISHTDKQDNDSRGYSGIEDDADVVWHAKRSEMNLRLELKKMKDGPDGRTMHLEATRALNSLTLTASAGPATLNTTESQLKILDALRIMPDGGVTGTELMATAKVDGRSTYYRALKDLTEAGHIAVTKVGRTKYYDLSQAQLDLTETGETDPPENTHD